MISCCSGDRDSTSQHDVSHLAGPSSLTPLLSSCYLLSCSEALFCALCSVPRLTHSAGPDCSSAGTNSFLQLSSGPPEPTLISTLASRLLILLLLSNSDSIFSIYLHFPALSDGGYLPLSSLLPSSPHTRRCSAHLCGADAVIHVLPVTTAQEQPAGERYISFILVGSITSFILLRYVCIIHEFRLALDKAISLWTDTGEAQSSLGLKPS